MNAKLQRFLRHRHAFRAAACAVTLAGLALPGTTPAATLQLGFTAPTSQNESNRQVVLEWNAEPAKTYLVQSADDLSPGSTWKTEEPVLATKVGPVRWMAPEALKERKYYRLILPQPEVIAVEPSFIDSGDTNAFLYLFGQCLPTNALVEINGQLFLAVAADTNGSSLRILSLNGLPPGQPILGKIRILNPANSNLITEWSVQSPLVYGPEPTLEQLQGPPDEPPASPVALLGAWFSKRGYDYYKAGSDMNAAGAQNNPYFEGNNLGGDMPTARRAGKVKPMRITCERGQVNDPGSRVGVGAAGDGYEQHADAVADVVVATGETRCQETDLAIPGVGLDFAWTRTYRSRTGPTTAQGVGWDFSYNVSLTHQANGTVVLSTGDGRLNTFYPDGTNGWFRDEYFVTIGDLDDDGQAERVTFPDTGKWIFHPPGTAAAGKLAQIVDRNSNTIALHYDVAGRLVEIVDTLNRTNLVTYNAGGQIESVTDFSGRMVRYEYDGHGDLVACVSPAVTGTPTGNDFPGGRTNRYTYTSGNADDRLNHNLTSCIDAKGQTWLELVYFTTNNPASRDFDAVATTLRGIDKKDIRRGMVIAKPGRIAPVLQVIENDYLGNVTETCFDSRFRPLEVREFTGRANPLLPTTATDNRPTGKLRADDPDYFETQFEWNADSLCTRVISPDGSSTEAVYQRAFNQNASRSNRNSFRSHDGDLRIIRERPCCDQDDDGDGVPDTLVTTFEYDARFGSPAMESRRLTGRGTVATGRIETGVVAVQGWDDIRKSKSYQNQTDADIVSRKGWDGTVKGSTHGRIITDRDSGRSKGFGFVISTTDPRGNVSTGEYDDYGNARRITFKAKEGATLARVLDFGHNPFGQLTTVTNAADATGFRRVDAFSYYSSGPQTGLLQAEACDATGLALTTSYEYDARGNVTRVVDARGNDWLFTYNALDELVRAESPTNLTARSRTDFIHDANGNLPEIVAELRDDADGFVRNISTRAEFDFLDRCTALVVQIAPGVLATNRFFYDANSQLITVQSPLAVSGADPHNAVAREYDERGFLFREIGAPGSTAAGTNEYSYTPTGQLKLKLGPANGGVERPGWGLAYDGFNRLLRVTDAMSNTVSYAYDRNDNLIHVQLHGEMNDAPGDAGNRLLAETRYTYDSLDRCVQRVDSFFNVVSQKPIGDGAATTTFSYAPNGDCSSVTDDNGHTTRFAYDTAGRLASVTDAKTNVVSYTYDACDNVLSVTRADRPDSGGAPQQFSVVSGYDRTHRLTRSVDNVGNTNRYAYDSRGNLVLHTNPRGNDTACVYDDLNRLTDTVSYSGARSGGITINTTHVEYDTKSRLVAATDSNTNTTAYAYDSLDNCVLITEADGTSRSLIWSPRSNLLREQDANGNVISNRYDLLDRCVASDITPGPNVAGTTTFLRYAYDGLSRLVAATNDTSASQFTYDSLDNRTHVVTDGWQMLSAHDAVGNRLSLTYPSGRLVTYTYNALDAVTSMSSSNGGLPAVVLANYEYEGPGRLGRIARANGVNSRYQWNGLVNPANAVGDFGWRQISGINHQVSGGGAVLDRRIFAYDRNQNKVARNQTVPFFVGGRTTTNAFTYDALDRLTQFTRASGGPDDLFRGYTLDGNGNRTLGISNGVAAPYIMDSTFPDPADFQMNQYTLTPFVVAPEQYDANGNLVSRVTATAQLQFTYDFADRLVQVADLSGGFPATIATYAYDALGRRIGQTIYPSGLPPVTTLFLGEPPGRDGDGATLEEHENGTLRRTFAFPHVFDQKARVMFTDTGATLHFLCDDLDNTLALTDAAGNVVERYDYDDYGMPQFLSVDGFPLAVNASPLGNRFLFQGMEWQPETGLYRLKEFTTAQEQTHAKPRNRIAGSSFDPQTGRPICRAKIDGGMPNRISMNVTVPKQTQGATFGERNKAGLTGSTGHNPWSGGGAKVQDHNSSRSNKSSSAVDQNGGGGDVTDPTLANRMTKGRKYTYHDAFPMQWQNSSLAVELINPIAMDKGLRFYARAEGGRHTPFQNKYRPQFRIYTTLSNVLKTRHEAAMAAIQNIR